MLDRPFPSSPLGACWDGLAGQINYGQNRRKSRKCGLVQARPNYTVSSLWGVRFARPMQLIYGVEEVATMVSTYT